MLQFLTFVLFITYILYKVSRSWTIGRDIFFSAEDYTNVVVLDQSTVTFQKGWGEGVITICVILDQSTVIFLKKLEAQPTEPVSLT